jgi:flagellar hook-associated protein FlgK
MRSHLFINVMAGGLLLVAPVVVAAQEPPPIDGVTGTVALEGAVDKTYAGVNTVIVKTEDGIEHLFHLTGRTVVHGGKATGERALRGLDEGSTVVVHYTAEGDDKTATEVDRIADDGLKVIEAVVTKVDRRAKTITIQLADGTRQTLSLTDRAAVDVGKDVDDAAADTAKVVVYFNDETGRRVVHYFKRVK